MTQPSPLLFIPKFTPSLRKEEREKGARSLFYFQTAILGLIPDDGMGKLTPNPETRDRCAFLEGRAPHHPWLRAVVCEYRGSGKTSSVYGYVLWRGLYIDGFTTKIVQNSRDNAKENYTQTMLKMFSEGDRAGYLRWLYEDRLRENLDGCNTLQFWFKSKKELNHPSITIWGLESKWESWHGDLVVLDDPEGADAEKSDVGNAMAWNAYQKAIPLLSRPTAGQILVVATPHGSNPLVYRLRRRDNWQSEADNERTGIKFFWRPLTDGSSNVSRWPERFPEWYVNDLRKDPIFDQQYMLKERPSGETVFDSQAIIDAFYTFAPGDRSIIQYPGYEFDPDKVGEDGFVRPIAKRCEAKIQGLRFYLHIDPKHRSGSEMRSNPTRPSMAAIAAVGVASDRHSFVLDTWTSSDAAIEKQAEKLFWFYRKYGPDYVVFESVGAQIWLKSWVKNMESMNPNWANPVSFGDILPPETHLPKMSIRMVESAKDSSLSKEYLFRESLSPWLNRGILHLRQDQDELRTQVDNATSESQPLDLLDCLCQGTTETELRPGQAKKIPWQPPTPEHVMREWKARRRWADLVTQRVGKISKWVGPGWRRAS